MKEAVELIEAVEETGRIYAYGENYCYMPGPYEMRRLYREGKIGEFEYGEGEYVHNCEPIWPDITYGDADHWRNHMYSTFYCTHSMGPLIHITGLRPVSVTGFEGPLNAKNFRNGAKGAPFGVEMVTLENGAVVKSIHGCFLHRNSIWYTAYGTKGRMETAREDAKLKDVRHLYVNADERDGVYAKLPVESYSPVRVFDEQAESFGHGGSDFYSMWHFVEKIKGNPEADIIDVYEAMDMFLPGLFAYRSILAGGVPVKIPDLRSRTAREQYRNDTACVDPKVAGDQLLPTAKGGTPEIAAEVYDRVREKWIKNRKK
jgi:predicted dehydrogenase